MHYLSEVCSQSEPMALKTPMGDVPSAARYLCWRVELEVRRMDTK